MTSYHSVSLLYVLSQSTLTARLVLSLSALGNARVSAGHRGSITLKACTALTHCHRRGPSARALLGAPCACARWKGGCWAQARCSSSHPPPVARVETNYSTLRRPSPALVVQPGLHRGVELVPHRIPARCSLPPLQSVHNLNTRHCPAIAFKPRAVSSVARFRKPIKHLTLLSETLLFFAQPFLVYGLFCILLGGFF